MTRTSIIQLLIDKVGAKKYLEIGMGPGVNFNEIKCDFKVSVDPTPTVRVTYTMTSDEFFKKNKEIFDVIFIDGLHWSDQLHKDIINSLSVLNEGGYIICHDINPMDELIQRYPQPVKESEWTGDCWKAWVRLRSERNDLIMEVVDTDYGCGIITRGLQEKININEDLTWDFLDKNRREILNLISVENFLEKYGQRN